jgi:hypothetical protein
MSKADKAVGQAGTNAIPALLRLLQARDSDLKVKLMALVKEQQIIKIEATTAEDWHWPAVRGFEILARLSLLASVTHFFVGAACAFPKESLDLSPKRRLVQTYPLHKFRAGAIKSQPLWLSHFCSVITGSRTRPPIWSASSAGRV